MSETPSKDVAAIGDEPSGVSRRTAVKVAAAAGVGAVVWAEPTIKGLARRPAYAANGSATTTASVMMTINLNGSTLTVVSYMPNTIDGVAISLDDIFVDGNNRPNLGDMSPQLNFISVDSDPDNVARNGNNAVVNGRIIFRRNGNGNDDGDHDLTATIQCSPL